MADIDGQSTSELVGRLEPEESAIHRGYMSIICSNQGPASVYAPYYGAVGSKDITYLNFGTQIPQFDVYEQLDAVTYKKCPYTNYRPDTGEITRQVSVNVGEATTKETGVTTLFKISVININQELASTRFFYTIKNALAADATLERFENDGSFS